MADIAKIGFASDSSGLVAAEQALNRLTPAAQRTEAAAAGVAGAMNATSSAAAGVATATGNAVKVITAANNSLNMSAANMNKSTVATNKLRNATQGLSHDAKNLSYQLIDVTQGLATGQPVYMVFMQQVGQIGQLMSAKGGLTGLFKELGNSVKAMITPMRLAGLGIVAFGAAALIAYSSWKSFTLGLSDTARIADTTTEELSKLQAAASFKGIKNEDFTAGIKTFSAAIYDARNNMGSLADLFTANNITIGTFEQNMSSVANLIQRAKNDQQRLVILQQAGLPATMEWVRLLSSGADGLKKAKDLASGFKVNNSLEQAARRFDETWNKAWTNFGLNARSGIQTALDYAQTFFDKMQNGAASLGNSSFWNRFLPSDHERRAREMGIEALSDFQKRFSGDTRNGSSNNLALQDGLRIRANSLLQGNTVDPNALKNSISLQQQAIGILGDLASVDQQVTAKRLELNMAMLNHVKISDADYKAIVNSAKAQAEMNRVNQQAAIGIFNINQAQKAASDTLQMWIDKGLVDKTNTEQMAAAQLVLARNIENTANAAAIAAAPLQQLRQLELDSSNLTKVLDTGLTGALTNLVSPIQDVLNGVTSIGDGFKNMGIIVLKAIQEMIIKMLILAPIARGLRAIFAGFSGGGLFGGGESIDPSGNFARGGVFPFANGGTFTNKLFNQPTPFMFAGGSKFGVMGEAGPEAVMPLRRGPNGSLGVQMFGGDNRRYSNDNMSIAYAPTYHLGGNVTQDDLNEVKKAQADDRRQFTSRVATSVRDIRKRSGGI